MYKKVRGDVSPRSFVIRAAALAFVAVLGMAFDSCSGRLGWGVLLWSVDEPEIASGTVLPVYIKSNINGVWVVGVPDAVASEQKKIELPLWQLELVGSKRKAEAHAAEFQEFAPLYAEALQDGLPIRVSPDNTSNRAYRLRLGQVIKVLAKANGVSPVSGGNPLPGEWLKVLTNDGVVGYCFSNRLKITDHPGAVASTDAQDQEQPEADPKLDLVLSHSWYPESYKDMVDSHRVDLTAFSEHWGFYPGQDSGIARISMPGVDLSYPYSSVKTIRSGAWRFEGSPLEVYLRSSNLIAVQYSDSAGALRTLLFTTLPADIDDLIAQEMQRRDSLFQGIYQRGPIFRSENYGTLSFTPEGGFSWIGFELLVPSVVPAKAQGAGKVEMRLFLNNELQKSYDGAFSLKFSGMDPDTYVDFLYVLESGGLRVEYLPPSSIEGTLAERRARAPTVVYFTRSER